MSAIQGSGPRRCRPSIARTSSSDAVLGGQHGVGRPRAQSSGSALADACAPWPAGRPAPPGTPPRRRPRRPRSRPLSRRVEQRRRARRRRSNWPSPRIRTITAAPPAALAAAAVLGRRRRRRVRAALDLRLGRLAGADLALEPGQLELDVAAGCDIRSSSAVMSSLAVPLTRRRARRWRAARRWRRPGPASAWVLSSARWIARPTSPISSEMPENASPILVCASAAV